MLQQGLNTLITTPVTEKNCCEYKVRIMNRKSDAGVDVTKFYTIIALLSCTLCQQRVEFHLMPWTCAAFECKTDESLALLRFKVRAYVHCIAVATKDKLLIKYGCLKHI